MGVWVGQNMKKGSFILSFSSILLAMLFSWPLSVSADQAQYFYDELGRLIGVMDGQGDIATYQYDAVGNLLSITQGPVTAPVITTVTPNSLEAGTPTLITFSGSGLGLVTLTASSPDLHISSVQHPSGTVLEATLLLDNPTTFGTLTVNAASPGGTTSFTLTSVQPMPTFTQLSVISGLPGTSLVITGTGFGTKPGSNLVTFPGAGGIRMNARVLAEAATALTVEVPEDVTDGDILVEVGGLTSNGLFFTSPRLDSISTVAAQGIPTNPAVASGNTGQTVSLHGLGLLPSFTVTIPTLDGQGISGTVLLPLTNVSADGLTATVFVPNNAVTSDWMLSGSHAAGIPMQIVPTVTGFSGTVGVGLELTLSGTGFQDGATTVLLSGASSPVSADVLGNNTLKIIVPVGITSGSLSVNTPGGKSADLAIALTDVQAVVATATEGSPANAGQASANVGQSIQVQGISLNNSVVLDIPTINSAGDLDIAMVTLTNASPDGTTATVTIPALATTGLWRISGSTVGGVAVQIVPTLTGVTGAVGIGTSINLMGSGFQEGSTTVFFSGTAGPVPGTDVTGVNDQVQVIIPTGFVGGGTTVTTMGGTSPSLALAPSDLQAIVATAGQGIPLNAGQPSANVFQTIQLQGMGLYNGAKVEVPTLDESGVSGVALVSLTNASSDATTAHVLVPAIAVTGSWRLQGSISPGLPLQIVPTLSGLTGTITVGMAINLLGSGFQESATTVFFPGAAGPVAATDVLGTNTQLTVVVPAGSTGDVPTVSTPGGTSNALVQGGPAIHSIEAIAEDGVPLDPGQPSSNAGRSIIVHGVGLAAGLQVTVPTIDNSGQPGPGSQAFLFGISPDGLTANVNLSNVATTGPVTLGASAVYLQIVPHLFNVLRQGPTIEPGVELLLVGRGFKPGGMLVHFEGMTEPVIPISVSVGFNHALRFRVPNGVSLVSPGTMASMTVSSDNGGTSNSFEISHPSITGVTSTAFLGTPLDPAVVSANIDQMIAVQGMGLIEIPSKNQTTNLEIDRFSTSGVISRTQILGGTIAPDGMSMTGIIRIRTITSELTVKDPHIFIGSGTVPLQVVPTLSNVTGTVSEGEILEFDGSGFDPNGTMVQFSGVATLVSMDTASILSGHGSFGGEVTVPAGVDPSGSVMVMTPGGSSEPFDLQLLTAGEEEIEPNNTPGTATRIITDVNTSGMKVGAIGTVGDIDYYRVDLDLNRGVHTQEGVVYLESAGDPILQLRVSILDKDLNVVFMTEGEVSTVGPPPPFSGSVPGMLSFSFQTPATGKYFVKIEETTGQGSAAHRYGLGMNLNVFDDF